MKIKNKHLLLLTLLLSQSAPLWGMDHDNNTSTPRHSTRTPSPTHDVDDLHRSIQEAISTIHQDPNYGRDATRVILVGDTGRGKTTLLHYLAGKDLHVKQIPNSKKYFLDVDSQNLLKGSSGPAPTVDSGTLFPSSWYDSSKNIVYWDCTGFRDSRGDVQEITNAFAIHQLFKNPVRIKIVVVAKETDAEDRAEVFLALLKRISDVLPNSTQLSPPSQGISFVLTNQRYYDPSVLLQSILNQLNTSKTHEFRDNAPVKNLVALLGTQHRNAAFPEPATLGAYPADHRSNILASINSVQPVENPSVNLVVSEKAGLLVRNYAQTLNDKICDLIRREGSQAIADYCNTHINNHVGNVGALRTTFRTMEEYLDGFKKGLLGLPNVQGNDLSPYLNTLFTQNIMSLPPTTSLRGMIEALSFLKTIDPTVKYDAGAWAQSWSTLIDKVKSLTTLDTNVTNGVLKMKGALIGVSDLNTIQQPITQADIFAFNTIIIDENITHHGLSLNLIAPYWKVTGNKTINISGSTGYTGANGTTPGANGQPGGPGGNGGNFYGKGENFYQVNLLTVNTNGGPGGKGGDGAKGSNGTDGKDGDLSKTILRQRKVIHEGLRGEEQLYAAVGKRLVNESKFITFENEYSYNDPGTDGERGGNGGKGGCGGKGGFKGDSKIDGYESGKTTSSDGGSGAAGTAGAGGQGGVHGRHCQGTHITGRLQEESYKVSRDGIPWWGWTIPFIGQVAGISTAIENAVLGDQTKYKLVPLPDMWEVPLGYQTSKGSSPNGNQGSGFNTTGQQNPSPQTSLNTGNVLPAYRTYYQQARGNPVTTEFVKAFSNL